MNLNEKSNYSFIFINPLNETSISLNYKDKQQTTVVLAVLVISVSKTNHILVSMSISKHLVITTSKLVHPKGDQSWVFTGRTDAKAETPILWPPHVKS